MCHRSHHRNVKKLTSKHGRSAVNTSNVGSSRTIHRCIHIMRTTSAHVGYTTALSRSHDAVGFSSDEALVVNLCEQERLYELCLNNRSRYRHQRFVRVDYRTFCDGINVTRERKMSKILQERL